MNKEFMEYVYKRCEVALVENVEYMKLESDESADQDKVQAKAEELCYLRGFQDAMTLLNN
jgi:hypothetical protein